MRTWSLLAARVLILAATGLAAACGDDDDSEDDAPRGTEVKVALREFEVSPDVTTVEAGPVTFHATNEGPEDEHELVVIRTDLAPDALPTKEDGAVDEEGTGIEAIGEIAEFEVGGKESATFDLEKGSYVLICNIVQEDEQDGKTVLESHYQQGMRVAFTVK